MTGLLIRLFGGGNNDGLTESAVKVDLPNTLTDNGSAQIGVIISYIFAFLGFMAFIGIVYSGVMYITAGGDAAKAATARKNLMWSIIGIIVVTLAFTIMRFVYAVVTKSGIS